LVVMFSRARWDSKKRDQGRQESVFMESSYKSEDGCGRDSHNRPYSAGYDQQAEKAATILAVAWKVGMTGQGQYYDSGSRQTGAMEMVRVRFEQ
jgi:hypothetical protein